MRSRRRGEDVESVLHVRYAKHLYKYMQRTSTHASRTMMWLFIFARALESLWYANQTASIAEDAEVACAAWHICASLCADDVWGLCVVVCDVRLVCTRIVWLMARFKTRRWAATERTLPNPRTHTDIIYTHIHTHSQTPIMTLIVQHGRETAHAVRSDADNKAQFCLEAYKVCWVCASSTVCTV